jgi:hypothetical protein
MIPLLAEAARKDRDAQLHLYRIVAEAIRSRLDPADAAIVAPWFDRLGAGEKAEAVFELPKGRRRGRTAKRGPMGDGRIPDDYDVAWLVKQAAERYRMTPTAAAQHVAAALQMNTATVRNIYVKLKGELG